MIQRFSLTLFLSLAVTACNMPSQANNGPVQIMPTLTGEPPIVIAHRGASGNVIEHTLEAYQRGIDMGADFIEPDLVLTKDGVLVARHENEISETTNVADKPEFADRKTTKSIDGTDYAGWFTEDFTLAELKTLRAKERLPDIRVENTSRDGQFEIPTFEEVLLLLKKHEEKTGERVGVYAETKHPSYFASIGLPHAKPMLELLKKYGFSDADDPVFIQSFEVANLRELNTKTNIRLVQLVAERGGPSDMPDVSYANMLTATGLTEIAQYADGIGPSKNLVIPRSIMGYLRSPTGLVAAAHKAGLLVHPWTFRAENVFLPKEFEADGSASAIGDMKGEIGVFLATGIDGLFSDNPLEAVMATDNFSAK